MRKKNVGPDKAGQALCPRFSGGWCHTVYQHRELGLRIAHRYFQALPLEVAAQGVWKFRMS